jgi:hypothetical protein
MLPSVALPSPHFQPHHHIDRRLNYDLFGRPYDMGQSGFLDPSFQQNAHTNHINNSTSTSTSNTFAASVPRSRIQFAHPVQHPLSHATDLNGLPTKTAEHTLRRKTPNGTLAAGYDGTPTDQANQPPAAKHILVNRQLTPSQLPLTADNWQPEHSVPLQYQNFPPSFKQDVSRNNGALPTDNFQPGTGASWVRSVNMQLGMDSALHQTLPMPHSQHYFLQNGPSIPTVLPATLQPCLGPTAPVGTGPYGPYWPDGAYIPYRPAALRDSRFDGSSPQIAGHNNAVFDMQPPFVNHTSFATGAFSNTGLSWNQLAAGPVNQDSLLQKNFPPRHSHQNSFGVAKELQQHHLPYHVRAASRQTADPVGWNHSPSVPPSLSKAQSRVQTVEFKEKVLSWAHGVYVDLLATIHHARKQSISRSTASGQPQRPLKPTIYPKPPRQPGLDFSSSHPNLPRHNSYPSSRFDFLPPDASLFNDKNRQSERSASGLMFGQDSTDTPRRASGTPLSKLAHNDTNIVATAASALEMLSHLCNESSWEWIEGMLLGGCLAYGLGDYQKAMRWYMRIIAKDAG